jgi:hypothetical protein
MIFNVRKKNSNCLYVNQRSAKLFLPTVNKPIKKGLKVGPFEFLEARDHTIARQ